jgi:hypothetical protein
MAGAGYKLFNTGDVLTAAQVNTYLMEQTVMVFADAAARTTALTGVVSEGMLSYLKSTKQVEVYNGTSWVASDDPNAIQNTIVDAKGDLITATAADTPARLAVGNNGETIDADSASSTGLRWQAAQHAGNIVLNSDFSVWQRGTSFSNPANGAYVADRWFMYYDGSGATRTISQQTFTGDNPSGCNASYYLRFAQTVAGTGGSVANAIYSKIEDARKLNGQTVVLSFWGKADATRSVTWQTYQEFGTGGSGAVLANSTSFSFTTSWQRFQVSFSMPSVSGKTIASNSSISFIVNFPLNAVGTFDITGIQLEPGTVATPFRTATGTIQGELAAAMRYYEKSDVNTIWSGNTTNASSYYIMTPFKVTKRGSTTVTTTNQGGLNFPTTNTVISDLGGFREERVANGTGSGSYFISSWTASAEL